MLCEGHVEGGMEGKGTIGGYGKGTRHMSRYQYTGKNRLAMVYAFEMEALKLFLNYPDLHIKMRPLTLYSSDNPTSPLYTTITIFSHAYLSLAQNSTSFSLCKCGPLCLKHPSINCLLEKCPPTLKTLTRNHLSFLTF